MRVLALGLVVVSASFIGCTDPPAPAQPAPATELKPDPITNPDVVAAAQAKKKHQAIDGYNSYDPTQDGQKQIDDAAAKAKADHKRVLVMFGGNWCKWCRALDGLFQENAAVKAQLEKSYVLVHVDSETNGKLDAALGNPFANGFPVFVVMDADGKKLHTQESGSLEVQQVEGQPVKVAHDPDKVLAFLQKYAS